MIDLKYFPSISEIAAVKAMSYDERERLKSDINAIQPANWLDAVGGKNGEYICPICGNGTGSDKSGVIPTDKGDKYVYGCRRGDCDFNGDVVSIIAKVNGLNTNLSEDMIQVLAIGAAIFNLSLSSAAALKPIRAGVRDESNVDNQKYIDAAQSILHKAQANIDSIPAEHRRGLTLETLKAFKCGYLSGYQPNSKAPIYPALLIPIGNGYCAIAVDRINLDSKYYKRNSYQVPLASFNLDALRKNQFVVVVEGAIDAMSIWQATGGAYPVIATIGVDGYKRFCREIAAFEDKKQILIMFDADDAGRKAANSFSVALNKLPNCLAVTKFLSDDISDVDANDILIDAGDTVAGDTFNRIIAGAINDLAAMASMPAELPETAVEMKKSKRGEIRDVNHNEHDELTTVDSGGNVVKSMLGVDKNAPIDLTIPIDYSLTLNGITQIKPDPKTGNARKYGLTHNPFIPVAIYEDYDTPNNPRRVFELAVYDKRQKHWRRNNFIDSNVTVDSKAIGILADFGVDFKESGKRLLGPYINAIINCGDNLFRIPHYQLFSQPGWYDSHFVYPTLRSNELVNGNGFDYIGAFGKAGGSTEFIYKMVETIDTSIQARLTIGAALAAPMLKLMMVRSFTLNLIGQTGNGKSAVQKLAAAIYGNPLIFGGNLNSTQMAIESRCVALSDFPNIVDDFQHARQSVKDNFAELVYNISGGKTKARLDNRGIQRVVSTYRTIIILSAEQTVFADSVGAGALNRILEMRLPKIDNADAIALHNFAETHYGVIGRDWVKWLEANQNNLDFAGALNQIKTSMRAAAEDKRFSVFVDISDHHLTMLAACWCALQAFDQFCLTQYNLDLNLSMANNKDSAMQMYNLLADVANDLPNTSNLQNSSRALIALEDFVNGHPRAFPAHNDKVDFPPNDLYGYVYDNGDVFIFPAALKIALQDFPSAAEIVRQLADSGKLDFNPKVDRQSRAYQKKVSIAKKQYWGYYFKELVEVDTTPASDKDYSADDDG